VQNKKNAGETDKEEGSSDGDDDDFNPTLAAMETEIKPKVLKTVNTLTKFLLKIGYMKLPYLKSTILSSKLAKGMGHNYYGEAAWPNDILYIFPVVIFGVASSVFGLAIIQPLGMGEPANGFATPLEILPEWYFFPIFNLLRVLSDKFVGILSNLYIPALLLVLPFGENLNRYQNPFRRPIMISIFLSTVVYSIWLGIGSLLPVVEALPFLLDV